MSSGRSSAGDGGAPAEPHRVRFWLSFLLPGAAAACTEALREVKGQFHWQSIQRTNLIFVENRSRTQVEEEEEEEEEYFVILLFIS